MCSVVIWFHSISLSITLRICVISLVLSFIRPFGSLWFVSVALHSSHGEIGSATAMLDDEVVKKRKEEVGEVKQKEPRTKSLGKIIGNVKTAKRPAGGRGEGVKSFLPSCCAQLILLVITEGCLVAAVWKGQ